jgi:hypothetical protein
LCHPAKSSVRRVIAQVLAEERRIYCHIGHHKIASFALHTSGLRAGLKRAAGWTNEMLMCDELRKKAQRNAAPDWAGVLQPKGEILL